MECVSPEWLATLRPDLFAIEGLTAMSTNGTR